MNIRELKELIADLPDHMEVFIDGDHQGTATAYSTWIGYVAGEDEYDYQWVSEDQIVDHYTDDDDQYTRDEVVRAFILCGIA